MITAINSLPYPIDPSKKLPAREYTSKPHLVNQDRIHHLLADSIPPVAKMDLAENQLILDLRAKQGVHF